MSSSPATRPASHTRPASRCPARPPVAMQQGRYLRATIRRELAGKPRQPFHFVDKGQMATIGRSRAIVEIGRLKSGRLSRLADLAGRPHLLPDRLQEPPAGRAAMGLVVPLVPPRRPADRQQGVAIPRAMIPNHTAARQTSRSARAVAFVIITRSVCGTHKIRGGVCNTARGTLRGYPVVAIMHPLHEANR